MWPRHILAVLMLGPWLMLIGTCTLMLVMSYLARRRD